MTDIVFKNRKEELIKKLTDSAIKAYYSLYDFDVVDEEDLNKDSIIQEISETLSNLTETAKVYDSWDEKKLADIVWNILCSYQYGYSDNYDDMVATLTSLRQRGRYFA